MIRTCLYLRFFAFVFARNLSKSFLVTVSESGYRLYITSSDTAFLPSTCL